MPLLDWLNKSAALKTAGRVPFRLLETVSQHGDTGGRQLPLAKEQAASDSVRQFKGLCGVVESEGAVARAAQAQSFGQGVKCKPGIACGAAQRFAG